MGNVHIFTLYCINTTFHTLNFNDLSKKGVIMPKNHHELKFEVSKKDYPSLFLASLPYRRYLNPTLKLNPIH